ncbi:RsmB/NOP family class I SAM-dependent RNA methyltransferase, partial [Aurantiacibacter xanthus]
MTPSARVQSAIEVLDLVIAAANSAGAPADRILADWFKNHRFAGSKDKRAIRELVYDVIRFCGPVPANGRAAMLALATESEEHDWLLDLFDGSNYGPAEPAEGEKVAETGFAPAWLEERLAASGLEAEDAIALLDRAPLDLRINTLKAAPDGLDLPEEGEALAVANALRLTTGTRVEQWDAYTQGLIEVQDAGSQLACAAVGAQPGELVIDLCAGAGGKTLALAAQMANEG